MSPGLAVGSDPADGTGDVVEVGPIALRRHWPLPRTDDDGDKGARGTVLVVGGSAETPGAAVLAGLAALRGGAGKLQLVVPASVATAVAVAVPEARCVGVAADGVDVSAAAVADLAATIGRADAVLVGSGALDHGAAADVVAAVVAHLGEGASLVLDAGALDVVRDRASVLAPVAARTVLLPNVDEAAGALGRGRDVVAGDPGAAAADLVARTGAVASVRAAVTWTASPDGTACRDAAGHAALGTSGSGDVLAGVVAGLAARGADPLTAALWGVHVHGRAGEELAGRHGGVGLLARELLDLVPALLNS